MRAARTPLHSRQAWCHRTLHVTARSTLAGVSSAPGRKAKAAKTAPDDSRNSGAGTFFIHVQFGVGNNTRHAEVQAFAALTDDSVLRRRYKRLTG